MQAFPKPFSLPCFLVSSWHETRGHAAVKTQNGFVHVPALTLSVLSNLSQTYLHRCVSSWVIVVPGPNYLLLTAGTLPLHQDHSDTTLCNVALSCENPSTSSTSNVLITLILGLRPMSFLFFRSTQLFAIFLLRLLDDPPLSVH